MITRATERSANQTLLHITREADSNLALEAETEAVSGNSLPDSEEEEDSIEAVILEAKEEIIMKAKEEISILKIAAIIQEVDSEDSEDVRNFGLFLF